MPQAPSRISVLILASALLSASSWVRAGDESQVETAPPQSVAEQSGAFSAPQIARMRALSDRINAVETDTGELLFISGNGRYLIRGRVADLWHSELIDSYDELLSLAERLDLERIGVNPADLGALTVGAGTGAPTVIFIDPRCPHCKDVLAALDADLLKAHRFSLVLLPVLGRESQQDAVRLACLAETDRDAAIRALREGTAQNLPSPEAGSTCGQESLQRSLIAAQLLGIGGVPFLVAPDGRTHRGAPPALAQWLDAAAAVAADATGSAQ
jgi:thiol:disulfide interchange protein DsbC